MNKSKILVLIDGFNVYHTIKNEKDIVRWINFNSLISSLMNHEKEELSKIMYFTALCTWDDRKLKRQKLYINELEKPYEGFSQLEVIEGSFQKVERKCLKCQNYYHMHVEKHTDVNIAVEIMSASINKNIDQIWIISNDSDISTAISEAKDINKNLKIDYVFLKIGDSKKSYKLQIVCDETIEIQRNHIAKHGFKNDSFANEILSTYE